MIDRLDPEDSAEEAGLRYVSDEMPGVRRKRAGKGWTYLDTDGTRITDPARLAWFKRLAIPPAWTDVWICPSKHGHLQATGRDARGRKVYRYHPRWRTVRDDEKYGRLLDFGKALPRIRRRVDRDLRRRGLPREKVLAAVVALLEKTSIRVGNEEYARENRSFGLTTMRDRHAKVGASKVRFRFRGKSGKQHEVPIIDRRLAGIVRRCQELPGQELFQYLDGDGEQRSVDSADVNAYIRDISGGDFTAKDFRTWRGTVLAAWALKEFEEVDSQAQAKKNVVRAVEQVAGALGNTPAVSRRSYVDPRVIEAYLDGNVVRETREQADRTIGESLSRLSPEEAAVLVLLRQRLREEEKAQRGRQAASSRPRARR